MGTKRYPEDFRREAVELAWSSDRLRYQVEIAERDERGASGEPSWDHRQSRCAYGSPRVSDQLHV